MLNRRAFLSDIGKGMLGALAYGVGKEVIGDLKYPAKRVDGSMKVARHMMVMCNGDYLAGCMWGDTGKGQAEVLVCTSDGEFIVDHAKGDLVTCILRGRVEIWAMPDMHWPRNKESFTRKVPFGPGYYTEIVGHPLADGKHQEC